ncbi:MAG: Gfo/Idh/MocA family oxidoreductase [Pseudomonadota bacterium]
MTNAIRWGILGAAKFAREHMAPAIHAAQDAKLAAIATSAAEKAAPFQAFQPDLKVYLNYDALLADPEIDAVYVPLPNHLHVEWTLKALDAGKHVLCEKPLAMQADQFDAVMAKRDATGLVAAEAYMIVHHPQWHKAKSLYDSGAIGDLILADSVFSYDNREDVANIRNRPETGGGSVPDIGVYTLGATRFVTGQDPATVTAHEVVLENGVDTFAHMSAAFEGPDFIFRSVTSMRMPPRQEVVFQGTGGIIRLTAPFNANVFDQAEVTLEKPGMAREVWRWPGTNQYVLQVENFGRSIANGADYPCPLEFSRGTQAMIDLFWASHRSQQNGE